MTRQPLIDCDSGRILYAGYDRNERPLPGQAKAKRPPSEAHMSPAASRRAHLRRQYARVRAELDRQNRNLLRAGNNT
jgi:hypothetical protein